MVAILIIFNCQLHKSHLRRESQLREYFNQIGLGACMWEIALIVNWYRRVQHTMGGTIPWAGGPRLCKKITWA